MVPSTAPSAVAHFQPYLGPGVVRILVVDPVTAYDNPMTTIYIYIYYIYIYIIYIYIY